MINLRNSPFLWLAALLVAAYVIVDLLQYRATPSGILMLLILFLAFATVNVLKYKPGYQLITTMSLSICVLTAGTIRQLAFEKENFPKQTADFKGKMVATVKVAAVLKAKQNSTTLRCEIISANYPEAKEKKAFSDKYLLVRLRGSKQIKIFPHDTLYVSGWVFPIQGPMNPHAFDLRQYYQTIGIRHQLSCADSTIRCHPKNGFSLMNLSAKWQSHLCLIVRQHTSSSVAQMTNALVFGERSALGEEIRDAFANSGAMHVLSVSGMHMAIIYSMLYLILGPPGAGSMSRRLLRLMLYTISIIIYVGLTGASPAVLRAGLMIILYLLGKSMGWNTQIWNLLGFAAFVMLWNDPFIWRNIGFQLSFLAMAGILLYAQPIIRYFTFRNILLHRIWEITAVSIAAQVFIIPVILHQFYQLPLTFILSSLVAMPASYLVIFGALLNIVLSPFHLEWLWSCYDLMGQLFLVIMKWLAGINPSMNFSMPFCTALLLHAGILVFSIGLIQQWANGKKIALGISIAALLTLGWHRTAQWTTNDLIVYHNYSGLIMDMVVQGRCISIQDSSVTGPQVEFSTRGNRAYRDVIHISQLQKGEAFSRANWHFSYSGFRSSALSFSIWDGGKNPKKTSAAVSYLLITHCPDIDALKIFLSENKYHFTILPVHLDRKTKKEIVKMLSKNEIKYWDIETQGYFKLWL